METAYFNGNYLPKNEIKISPDDRGFLFADGIYEVVRWYEGFFYDIENHLIRLKRSMGELKIAWPEADAFPEICRRLVMMNNLQEQPAMVYFQVTRGASRRSHSFPLPEVPPTIYSYSWGFQPDWELQESGIRVMLKEDIRWSRCDIKSVALLPNTISFQEACERGLRECVFIRNGFITEGSHSNIFFVLDGALHTHAESNHILSGITRKNIIRIAKTLGIKVIEEALPASEIKIIQEAFISNTSSEIMPVIEIGGQLISDGKPGPVTRQILKKFTEEIKLFKG